MRTVSLSAALFAAAVSVTPVFAGSASKVVSYSAGSASTYTDPASALGLPTGITGVGTAYQGVVSPFNPPYDANQIVLIGDGGQLTLQLDKPIAVKPGPQLGVFSNVGLIDTAYPSGQAGSPAGAFGGGSADVRVSADGKSFVDLGTLKFDVPTNFYTNAGVYDTIAPAAPKVADFSKPFVGDVSAFSGKDAAGVLKALNGSGGGTWLDVSKSGLKTVEFVQFIEPKIGDPTHRLAIDAVSAVTGSSGGNGGGGGTSPVPLPPAALMGLLALPIACRAMRRRQPA